MAKTRSFDAGREHLGHVYAQALIGAAEKEGLTEQVMQELDSIVIDVLDRVPNLLQALSAPKVKLEDQERIIDKSFGAASPVLVHALKVMARHGRLEVLREVHAASRKIYNQLRGRVEVQVRVASPISSEVQAQVANRLRGMLGKEVDLQVEIRPEILGGMIVQVGDTLYDASLVAQLDQMRHKALSVTEREFRSSTERFVAVEAN